MPVYNESERIGDALDDVFGTEWPFSVELIVVDDGSTDGTRDFLRSYRVARLGRTSTRTSATRARAAPCGRRSATPPGASR